MNNLFLEDYQHSDKETSSTTTGRSATRLQPAKRDLSQPPAARGNRFGFRQNVVRPTTGITPKFNDFDNVNNNSPSVNDKRRSRSATAAARTSVTIAQPTVKTVNEEQPHTNAE